MIKLSFVLAIVLVLSGCSDRFYLHRAEKNIRKAVARGADVDTLHSEKWDTLKILALKDRIHTDPPRLDNTKLRGLIGDLSRMDPAKPVEPAVIYRMREAVCPEVSIDTTYDMELFAQGAKYVLPITVKIAASGKGHDYSIRAGALRVPVRVETNRVSIKAGHGFWYDVKLSFVSSILGALIMFILIRGGPLRNFVIRLENNEKPPD